MTIKNCTISLIILTSCLFCAYAQNIQFGLEPAPYYKGTPFNYQVTVKNKKPDAPPKMAESSDFIVTPLAPSTSSSSYVSMINGDIKRVTNTATIYTFMMTPKRIGRLATPPCTITIQGKKHTIPPKTITVSKPDTNQTITLTMTADQKVCAVGQPVKLSFQWTIKLPRGDFGFQQPIQNYQLTIPALNQDGLDAEPVSISQNNAYNRRTTPIIANKQTPLEAVQSQYGNKFILSFSINVIPRTPGQLTLKPATIIADVADPKASRRRDPWSSFFDEPQTVKCAAQSQPYTIAVKEPPTANRPNSYTGLAEPCTIETKADKTDVYVGDPIVLSITLKGPRFPNSIILPKLQNNKEFKDQFRIFDNNAPGIPKPDGSVTFQRTIRAASTEVTTIPAVSISWFDAKDGNYHTASSKPIPITVKATKAAVAVAGQTDQKVVEKIDVTANLDGPKPNFPPQDCLQNQAMPEDAKSLPWGMILLVGMPLLTLIVALGKTVQKYRRQNAPMNRQRKAASNALHLLKKAAGKPDPASAALHALQSYVAAKTQHNRDSITLQDMEQFLQAKQAPSHVLEQLRTVVNDCEAAIYAKQPLTDPTQTIEDMEKLISHMEKL